MNKEQLLKKVRKDMEYAAEINTTRELYNTAWGMIDDIEKLDESKKPVISKEAADYIDENKDDLGLFGCIRCVLNRKEKGNEGELDTWILNNEDTFLEAWTNGYEIKKPMYYAKIKGHELVDTEKVIDDEGVDVSEWNRNIYFILQRNKQIVVDMKDSGLSGAKHYMTLKEWNELGINENNADFEEVPDHG